MPKIQIFLVGFMPINSGVCLFCEKKFNTFHSCDVDLLTYF